METSDLFSIFGNQKKIAHLIAGHPVAVTAGHKSGKDAIKKIKVDLKEPTCAIVEIVEIVEIVQPTTPPLIQGNTSGTLTSGQLLNTTSPAVASTLPSPLARCDAPSRTLSAVTPARSLSITPPSTVPALEGSLNLTMVLPSDPPALDPEICPNRGPLVPDCHTDGVACSAGYALNLMEPQLGSGINKEEVVQSLHPLEGRLDQDIAHRVGLPVVPAQMASPRRDPLLTTTWVGSSRDLKH
jgi:hypothetical protein